MDLGLHGKALWRYRRIALVGVTLAVVLAVLSAARPTVDGGVPTLVYRTNEVWQSQARLLLTREGFREGRVTSSGDFLRFSELADLYAAMVTSDPVMEILEKRSGTNGRGRVTAAALRSATQGPSPLLAIWGKGPSPVRAQTLTENATRAFLVYLGQRQAAAGIPARDRVSLSVLTQKDPPVLLEPRKKTLPIMILLAVLSSTMGLVYILERGRRGVRAAGPAIHAEPVHAEPGPHAVRPAAVEPAAVEPVVREPVVREPVVREPVVREPAPVEHLVSEPVAVEQPEATQDDDLEQVVTRRWA